MKLDIFSLYQIQTGGLALLVEQPFVPDMDWCCKISVAREQVLDSSIKANSLLGGQRSFFVWPRSFSHLEVLVNSSWGKSVAVQMCT